MFLKCPAWGRYGTRLERSAGRGLSKFVGRDEEKEEFRKALEESKVGKGQVLAVEAEPGVGKSRLFLEFKTEANSDWALAEGFSISHGKNSVLLPIIDLLHSYLGIEHGDAASLRRAKLAAKIGAADGPLQSELLYLCSLLEIDEDKDKLAAMDPELRRVRTHQAIIRMFISESKRRPLILIVEDLHWLDDESQALLDRLVNSIESAKILLLVNYRPEYLLRWADKAYCRRIRLEPLGRSNAGEMLKEMLGTSDDLAPLRQLITESTGGTPFFIEESVLGLLDEGTIERVDGAVRLVKPLHSLRIPPTVQAILAARIDRLHNDEKTLLQTLAVVGREFVFSLACAVFGRKAEELERLITNLQLGEFVHEQPSVSDVEYIFKHALTQEVAYNSLLSERRKQLHESVGRAIELLYSDSLEEHVVELSHHFSKSGNLFKSIEYLTRAGIQKLSRGALMQGLQDLESAQRLLLGVPAGEARDKAELPILSALGTAYIAARGYAAPEVGPAFQRAREISARFGEPEQQFAVVFGNFAWRLVRGEINSSLEQAKEAISIAQKFDDPGMWMEALMLMGVTLFYRGEFSAARAQHEKALSLYDDRERNRYWAARVGEDAGVTHRCYLALSLWHLGYPEQALRVNREMRALARTIAHPFSLAYAQHHTSWLYQLMRLPTETLLFSDEQVQTSTEQGFPLFRATGVIYGASAKLQDPKVENALVGLELGIDAYRATGAALAMPYYLGLLGDALAQRGQHRDAKSVLDDALAIAAAGNDRCHQAELYRLKGELACNGGDCSSDAEELLLGSIDTARCQESKAFELRATTQLADFFQTTGRRSAAIEALGAAYNNFSEGFMMPDLCEAKKLLDELQSA